MKIVFDARSLRPAGDDGAGRIVRALVRDLGRHAEPDDRIVVFARPEACFALETQKGPRTIVAPLAIEPARPRQQLAMMPVLEAYEPDVYVYPQLDLPFTPPGMATVAALFDLTPLKEPTYFGAGRGVRRIAASALLASTLARASVLLTISEAMRNEISAFARRDDIAVALPGPTPLVAAHDVVREKHTFLYVGNFRPHKRVPFLLEAFGRARLRVPSLSLILASRPDPRFNLQPLLEGPFGEGVTWLKDVDDETLPRLYGSARALVFPSVGEGFGFPVVEAFSVGTPVIVADAGSLPEVAGKGGLVVPADDVAAWSNALTRLAGDDALWWRLSESTASELARFSWDEQARAWWSAIRAAKRVAR